MICNAAGTENKIYGNFSMPKCSCLAVSISMCLFNYKLSERFRNIKANEFLKKHRDFQGISVRLIQLLQGNTKEAAQVVFSNCG